MGPFNERMYSVGFAHAISDIRDESLAYAEGICADAAKQLGDGWYAVGYTTCINAYKEGRAR